MIYGVFLGHNDYAASSVKAAELVIGAQSGYTSMSNEMKSLADIEKDLEKIIENFKENEIFIFVDFYGSSFSTPVLRMKNRSPEKIFIIFGYNLPIVIDFFIHREKKKGKELSEKLLSIGRGAVRE